MKTGDVMAALRSCPGGWPFHVKIGDQIYDKGLIELDDKGVTLVLESKEPVPKKRGRPRKE